MFGCLFHGVWGFCVRVPLQLFSHVIFSLVPVDRHQWVHFFWLVTGTNACKGSWCLVSGFRLGLSHGVVSCRFVTLFACGVWCMCHIRVIFSVFSFFLLCDDGKKDCYIYFITTEQRVPAWGCKRWGECPSLSQEDSVKGLELTWAIISKRAKYSFKSFWRVR